MVNRISWIGALALVALLVAPSVLAQETESQPEEVPANEPAPAHEAAPAGEPAPAPPVAEEPAVAVDPAEAPLVLETEAQARARQLAELGTKAFKGKKYAEAALAFEAAFGEEPAVVFAFNAAQAWQLDGRLATAKAKYESLVEDDGLDAGLRRVAANALVEIGVVLMKREAARAALTDEAEIQKATAAAERDAAKAQKALEKAQANLEKKRAKLGEATPSQPFAPQAVDNSKAARELESAGLRAYHAGEYEVATDAFNAWSALTHSPEAQRARLRVAIRTGTVRHAARLLEALDGREDLPDWLRAEVPYLAQRIQADKDRQDDSLHRFMRRGEHEEQHKALGETVAGAEDATTRGQLLARDRKTNDEVRDALVASVREAVAARDAAVRAQRVLKQAATEAAESGDRRGAARLEESLLDAVLDEQEAVRWATTARRSLGEHMTAVEADLDVARSSANAAAIAEASARVEAAELALDQADEAAEGESEPFSIFDKVLIQLNWGDDNLLIGAGETRESSPDPNFGRCSRTSIDGITGRDCAEGQSRLGLYKNVDVGEGFSVAGALVLGLGVVTDPESSKAGSVSLFDLGSYLKLDKRFGDSGARLFVEMYPVDARPLAAGFHPDIEWGTKDEFPKNFRRGAAPGVKVGFDSGAFYAYVGAKTALIKSPLEVELESDIGNRILFSTRTFYGVLGGVGLHLDSIGLSVEANGGFFHKGTLTKEGVLGKDLLAGGGSARIGYHMGMPIGLRVDSSLYERSASGARTVETPSYEGSFAFNTAIEGTMGVQNLSDFERPGSTALEWAYAGHLGFQARFDALRLHVEARARTLSYITAEVPGFFPYSTTPSTAETSPEVQGLVSVDYKLGDFTIALTGGLRMPATYRGLPPQGTGTDAASGGVRTVVVSEADAGGWYILNDGRSARLVGWGELGLRWSPAPEFSLMAEILYGRDDNRTQVERDALGHALRVHTEPNILGLNLLGQFLF